MLILSDFYIHKDLLISIYADTITPFFYFAAYSNKCIRSNLQITRRNRITANRNADLVHGLLYNNNPKLKNNKAFMVMAKGNLFFILPIPIITVLICTADDAVAQLTDTWQIIGNLSSTVRSEGRSGRIMTSRKEFEQNGTIVMTVGSANHGNGYIHLLGEGSEDKIFEKNISGSTNEFIYLCDPDRKDIRHDEYYGVIEDGGVELEYDPEPDGIKGFQGGIRFTRKGKWNEEKIHFYDDGRTKYDEGVDSGSPGFYVLDGSEHAKITKVKNGFLIDGFENKDTTFESGFETVHETIRRSCHFSILKESALEAFIEPVTPAEYKKWLPMGPDPLDKDNTGNSVDFTVYVKDRKKGIEKSKSPIKQVTYFLEASHEPGYAMNFPGDNPDTRADLQLSNKMKKPDPRKENLKLTVSASEDADLIGKVHSLDYGAYGKIIALVELTSGEVLEAKSAQGQRPYCLIPDRKTEQSQIADYWKDLNHASDLKDEDDSEIQNNLGDGHAGDGLTVYEEYRGFIENQKHIRTDPKKLDLMVCDLINGRSKDGITMFRNVTGINVHDKFKEIEFGKVDDDRVSGFISDKCINCNSSQKTHEVDQHGIAIIKKDSALGYAQAVPIDPSGNLGTPKRYHFVEITNDFNPHPEGYAISKGTIDKDGKLITDPNGKAKIITDEYAVTVAHEMLHCCNIFHHGDLDRREVILKKGEGVRNGIPGNIYVSIDSSPFKIANVFWDDENSTPVSVNEIPDQRMVIGAKGGEHSGVENCIMRYDAARGYFNGSDIYLIKSRLFVAQKDLKIPYSSPMVEYAESTGTELCSSSKGTGVNAADHKPRPRYGDATKGDCRHQFCINDKYH